MTTQTVKLKGPQFTGPDDQHLMQSVRALTPVKRQAWWTEYVERWRVIGTCQFCGEDLIQEELAAHRLKHVEDALRPLARLVARQPREQRLKLMHLYCRTCGALLGAEPCECSSR